MPEREFELYLDLLGRLLRLRPEQRAEIADELRDHLEARLDELTAAGLSREDAVRRALEEFGDAAGLAGHFTHIAREKRRRMIMRCTLGTVVATAVALLALSAFWPPQVAVNLPGRVVAQEVQEPAAADPDPGPGDSGAAGENVRDETIPQVEAKLEKRIDAAFEETPLSEALEFVGDAIGVDFVLDRKSLEDIGLQPDVPVTLKLQHTDVPARTVLDVILNQLGLTYIIRDGFIYVLTKEEAENYLVVDVYNVRDLLKGLAVEPDPREASTSAARFQVQTVQFGGNPEPAVKTPADRLADVIMNSTEGPWEEIDGTGGTIAEFNGLFVVRQTQQVHREIKDVLKMMREAHKQQEQAAPAVRAANAIPARAVEARRA
jgi:hypothetical protein